MAFIANHTRVFFSLRDKSLRYDIRLLFIQWESSDYFSVPGRLINHRLHVSLWRERFALASL